MIWLEPETRFVFPPASSGNGISPTIHLSESFYFLLAIAVKKHRNSTPNSVLTISKDSHTIHQMIPNTQLDEEVQLINQEMTIVRNVFLATLDLIPAFSITNENLLPYGLRAHTRSISWIAEQVITQQAKHHAAQLGITDVDIDLPDTCLHDCVISVGENRYFVNVKMHNADGKHTRNDISAVEKLFMQYSANPNYRLIYAVFGLRFQNINISFVRQDVHVFSPQFLPIYVNPRNDKIQALYNHVPIARTRNDFLQLLRDNSRSIILE